MTARSSLVLCVDIEGLLSRARALLDKVAVWQGDDGEHELEAQAVAAELDEVLTAIRGLPPSGGSR